MFIVFRWDINTLLEKIPKLGAVIDLTNTTRYYDPRVSAFGFISVLALLYNAILDLIFSRPLK